MPAIFFATGVSVKTPAVGRLQALGHDTGSAPTGRPLAPMATTQVVHFCCVMLCGHELTGNLQTQNFALETQLLNATSDGLDDCYDDEAPLNRQPVHGVKVASLVPAKQQLSVPVPVQPLVGAEGSQEEEHNMTVQVQPPGAVSDKRPVEQNLVQRIMEATAKQLADEKADKKAKALAAQKARQEAREAAVAAREEAKRAAAGKKSKDGKGAAKKKRVQIEEEEQEYEDEDEEEEEEEDGEGEGDVSDEEEEEEEVGEEESDEEDNMPLAQQAAEGKGKRAPARAAAAKKCASGSTSHVFRSKRGRRG